MIQSLKPTERLRVYDLVRQAGVDVSDWSNYKRPESPEINPKYCYEWCFVTQDRVVICLWFGDMKEDTSGAFQILNYAKVLVQRPELSSIHKTRYKRMDEAFRTAFQKHLPVRAIILDGPADQNGDRSVKCRGLDPEPWHIDSYNEESGLCRLQRGSGPDAFTASPDDDTFNDLAGIDLTLLGRDEAQRALKTVSGVKRDPAVRREVIKRCKGTCERPGCGASRDFPGFLDVHHILGAEKSDRAWTCVALCPNCHREAHFSRDCDELNLRLLEFARQFSPAPKGKSDE